MPKDFYCIKCDAGPYMDPGPCPICGAMLESLEFSDGTGGDQRYTSRQMKEAESFDSFDEDDARYADPYEDEDGMYGVHFEEE